jgi:TPP-dependent pyruvate/acetoin dehydrogenase alpha subunit
MTPLDRYRTMRLIREAEERIRRDYAANAMKTPVHLCIGAEAIPTGFCSVLEPDARLFGTYRNHGWYLARSGDLHGFFGELYGRTTGIARGKAGSMHLAHPDSGLVLTSAVVATTIPVAVGAALAHQRLGHTAPVVVAFGDGAVEEGAFWESLNAACVWRLPLCFVCEDNDLAIHSRAAARQGFRSIIDAVSAFRCRVFDVAGDDVEAVTGVARTALDHVRHGEGPAFVRCTWHRSLEHVGILVEDPAPDRDPLRRAEASLLATGVAQTQIDAIAAEVTAAIDVAVAAAQEAPLPAIDDLWTDVRV